MASTPNAVQTPTFERMGSISTPLEMDAKLAPAITAPANVKISFSQPVVSSKPAPKKVEPVIVATPQTPPAEQNIVTPAPELAAAGKVNTPAQQAPVAPVAAQPAAQAPVAPIQNTTPTGGNTAASSKGAAIAAAARAQLGVSQDCTMLVTNSLKAVGINFHDWPAGYLSLGTVIPLSQAKEGDLLYYSDGGLGRAHISVYLSPGQSVHGGWMGNQTAIGPVNLGSGPVVIRVS